MAYGYYAGGGGEIPKVLLIFFVVYGMFALDPLAGFGILFCLGMFIFLLTQVDWDNVGLDEKDIEDKKRWKSASERFSEGYRWCSRCIHIPTTRLVIDKSIKNCPKCGCFLRYAKSWSQTDKSGLNMHETFRLKDEEDRYYDDLCDEEKGVYYDV